MAAAVVGRARGGGRATGTGAAEFVYFDPAAGTGPMLVLGAWLVGSILVIVAAAALRRRPRPAGPHEAAPTVAEPSD